MKNEWTPGTFTHDSTSLCRIRVWRDTLFKWVTLQTKSEDWTPISKQYMAQPSGSYPLEFDLHFLKYISVSSIVVHHLENKVVHAQWSAQWLPTVARSIYTYDTRCCTTVCKVCPCHEVLYPDYFRSNARLFQIYLMFYSKFILFERVNLFSCSLKIDTKHQHLLQ